MTVVSEPRKPPAADASEPARESPAELALGLPPPVDLVRLVRERQAEVWRYLRYLGADPPEADDLTQETFLALARSNFVEQSDAQTSGYLRTVARRQLLMLRRTQKRRINTVDLDAADAVWGQAFDGANPWDDHVEAARGCVEKLDGRAKRAIDLAYRDSVGREAIAEQLNMKPDGVKTLLRRTRAKLRECIEKTLARTTSDPK
ncbi:RNA polymerase sigma factor [Planctomycetes bacterium MalM25]|nr:RNA polymerase sigma factor [Planctomycetes bacterium MalM25]